MVLRRWLAAVAGAAALVAGTVTASAGAASAATGDGYYRASYSDTVYRVDDGKAVALTYGQWVAAGRPAARAATVTYSAYSWDQTVYRATTLGAASLPLHVETYAEWVQAGRPRPAAGSATGAPVTQWSTGDELFATTPDGLVHHLTGAEWAALGRPAPTVAVDQGYEKLSWSPEIVKTTSVAGGRGAPISYAQWAAAGFPTPRSLPRFPGDVFYSYPGESTIYYQGPPFTRAVDVLQWGAAGYPTPTAPPAGAPRHTVRRSVTPVGASGGVAAGYRVTRTAAGECFGASEAGGDVRGFAVAFRCSTGDLIQDPCWKAMTASASVLCLADPWSTTATRVVLPSTPDGSVLGSQAGRDAPWGLELADGRHCAAVEGAHATVRGQALDWTCTDGSSVLADLDEDAPGWTAQVVRPTGGGSYGAATTVAVSAAVYLRSSLG